MSREDAQSQARALGVSFSTISIEQMFEATLGRCGRNSPVALLMRRRRTFRPAAAGCC